jgi:hypothetical protein
LAQDAGSPPAGRSLIGLPRWCGRWLQGSGGRERDSAADQQREPVRRSAGPGRPSFGPAMSSMVLAGCRPERFTVVDSRALKTLRTRADAARPARVAARRLAAVPQCLPNAGRTVRSQPAPGGPSTVHRRARSAFVQWWLTCRWMRSVRMANSDRQSRLRRPTALARRTAATCAPHVGPAATVRDGSRVPPSTGQSRHGEHPGARVSVAETLIGGACQQPRFAESDVRHSRRMIRSTLPGTDVYARDLDTPTPRARRCRLTL